MTNKSLAHDYFKKATIRLKALHTLHNEGGYSDVIREGQELVELLLKGLLRLVFIDPPKWHDVGSILKEHKEKLPESVQKDLERICKFSSDLRKEREISFYGEDDFLPTESYSKEDSVLCLNEVIWLHKLLTEFFQ